MMAKAPINEATFYRARAIDMMKKAQSAQSETTRQIYLDLAQKWSDQADSLQNSAQSTGSATAPSPGEGGSADNSSASTN